MGCAKKVFKQELFFVKIQELSFYLVKNCSGDAAIVKFWSLTFILSCPWSYREKDEDEGIPSETEDDKRQLETKAKEMRGEKKAFKVKNIFHLTQIYCSHSISLSLCRRQTCWSRRIQRSCRCWRRRCSSSGGCGRAWIQARRSAGRSTLSSGPPAPWRRRVACLSWRRRCRKVRRAHSTERWSCFCTPPNGH